MRDVKLPGLCLLAVCALSAVAVSSASAALPELGRCEPVEAVKEGKKTVHHGVYSNKACTVHNAKTKGKYEWTAGPGANNTFTAETSEWILETQDGAKVECTEGTLKGAEFTGPKTEKFSSIELANCLTGLGKHCQTNPRDENFIEDPTSVEGELGTIKGTAPKQTYGWDLKGVKFLFTCGTPPEAEVIELVEGSVIGAIKRGESSNLNVMASNTQVFYKQEEGSQLPEAFEGGSKDTLTTTAIAGASKTEEQTGLSGAQLSRNFGEPLEIKTKE
jgi:hypothetical protein